MGALHLRRHQGRSTNSNSSSCSDSDKSCGSDEDWCVIDDHLHITDHLNLDSLAKSVSQLLTALGEDISRDGLLKTPSRVARALLTATRGYHLSPGETIGGALFAEAGAGNGSGGGSGGIVIVKNTDLFSTCESCLLPLKIRCHISYIPCGQRVVGLSKLPRVAEIFAARLQSPQRLVNEIAQALADGFKPLGVAVVAECWHLEPAVIGVASSAWVRSTVSARRGKFEDAGSVEWGEFLAMLSISGFQLGRKSSPCPRVACCQEAHHTPGVDFAAMVEAVESLLQTLGEDHSRKELRLTPTRYARWLLDSTQGSRLPASWILNPVAVDLERTNAAERADASSIQVALDVPFCSQCEHHLLPFTGVAHIGFVGRKWRADRVVLERIVRLFSCRLQVQERLTRQIAEAVMGSCGATGVMVVAEASHICMISRGVRKTGSSTATLATLGSFASDAKARSEFLQIIAAARGPLPENNSSY